MSRSRSSSSSNKSKRSNRRSQSKHKQRRRSRSGSQSNMKSQKGQNPCLYIGNLDKRLPQQKLKEICSQYGKFQYCYIVYQPTSHFDRNKQTKISRGYAFVKFQNPLDAQKAKQALHERQIMSRKVSVQFSKRAKPRESTPGRYLGRRRSPVRRDRGYRRRSYSRSSSGDYKRRRKYSSQRERKHRDHKESKRRDRDRSRSGQKKHKKRRDSRSNSPKK